MTIGLQELTGRFSRLLSWAGGAMIMAAAAVICIEVVLRGAFHKSFAGVDELAGYALAISTTWACGFALIGKAHVRIDTLYYMLPRALRPYLDISALAVLFSFVAMLTYHASVLTALSFQFGSRSVTPLATPLWIPQGLWVFGLITFLLVILVLLAGAVVALASGQTALVSRLAGPVSVDEELQAELADIARRRPTSENPS